MNGLPKGVALPGHLSHSSRDTLLRCAKSFFLSRLTPAPKQPTLWLATGSAVHIVTETWDNVQAAIGGDPEWDEKQLRSVWDVAFGDQLEELRAKDSNEFHWRGSKNETIAWWNRMGPQMVEAYISWRKRSPYTIWTTPDGEPAIELDVSGYLPGCEVEIKGYIDRIFFDPVFNQLIIVDIKTSKSPPKGADQFAVYAALMAAKWPEAVAPLGAAYMTREGTLATPWPLLAYTPEAVGELYQEAWEQIKAGKFDANPGDACRICDVSSSCAAINGPLARIYDPASPGYEEPPF